MMNSVTRCIISYQTIVLLFIFLIAGTSNTSAQYFLKKEITVKFDRSRLADALKEISIQGGFTFSYNSKLIRKDSLITFSAEKVPVESVLNDLLKGNYEYEEQHNYIIIVPTLPHLSFINTDITNDNNMYSISGIVTDERNGQRLMNASVYEKQSLTSVLTDEHGYFRLKVRTSNPHMVSITASKMLYKNASLNILQPVAISSRTGSDDYNRAAKNRNGVERDALGRLLITARQKIQSLNVPDFFAKRPFQFSLTPGLSTHGLFSSQVVNKFSLNLVGGYTAGVNGLEIGGLFNINKENSKYFQLAGIFNLVGGTMKGVQLSGINNHTLDTVKGAQIAAFMNKSDGQVSGVQFAAINNEAKKLKGLQIGLINVADTSYGASIGLINIIGNGFYKVSLSANSLVNTNISLTTGTHRFYSILTIGTDIGSADKQLLFGGGIGHDFMISDKVFVAAQAKYLLTGSNFTFQDRIKQGKLLLNIQLTNKLSLFAGPVYHIYNTTRENPDFPLAPKDGTVSPLIRRKENSLGWEAGIAFNSVFKSVPRLKYDADDWYLGAGPLAGIDIKSEKFVAGAEIFTQRNLNGGTAATFSIGYTKHFANQHNMPERPVGSYYFGYYDDVDLKTLPVKAGMRKYAGKKFFFSGELGMMIGLDNYSRYASFDANGTKTTEIKEKIPNSFIAGISGGFIFNKNFESSIKFENYSELDIKLIMLRAAYRFKL